MTEFSLHIDTKEDVFLQVLKEDMESVSKKIPTIQALIENVLGLTSITDEDFLSPVGKTLEEINTERVIGNTCLQQRKIMTSADEDRLFAEALKYR